MRAYQRNIWRSYLFQFLIAMHFMSGVLVPFFVDWGHLRFSQIMMLQALFAVSVFAFEVPTGAVADRHGRKTSLLLGAAVNFFAALIYGSAPQFWVFACGEVLWALAVSLVSGADQALLYDSLKADGLEAESKAVLGRKSSFMLAGITLAAPIGGLIAAGPGLRYTVLLMALPISLAFLVGLGLREPPRGERPSRRSILEGLRQGVQTFREVRPVRLLTLELVVANTPAFLIIWTYQVRLRELGVPVAAFGIMQAAVGAIQLPVLNNFARLEHLAGSRRRYLFLSAAIPGACYLVLAFTSQLALTIGLVLIIPALGMTRGALLENYLHKHIESDRRATVMSTVSMINRAASALLMPLIGLIVDRSTQAAFILLGVLLLVASFLGLAREEHLTDQSAR